MLMKKLVAACIVSSCTMQLSV